MKPKIYEFEGFPIKGEMGAQTNIERTVACDDCGRIEETIHTLSYCFDEWRGEDVIKGALFYLVSERMKAKLEALDVAGLGFTQVINETADHFEIHKPAYQDTLPTFYKLDIGATCKGTELWWEREEVCPTCGDQKWDTTIKGLESICAYDEDDPYHPREVYADSWHGEGLFLLEDPASPLITETLLSEMQSITQQKLILKEAVWVE